MSKNKNMNSHIMAAKFDTEAIVSCLNRAAEEEMQAKAEAEAKARKANAKAEAEAKADVLTNGDEGHRSVAQTGYDMASRLWGDDDSSQDVIVEYDFD